MATNNQKIAGGPPLLAILETIPLMGDECGYAQAQEYYTGTQEQWDRELAHAVKRGLVTVVETVICNMCEWAKKNEPMWTICPEGYTVYAVTDAGTAEYKRLCKEQGIK